jgi:hypothetical protein
MKNKFSVLAAIACLVVVSFAFAACTNKLLPPKDISGLRGYSFGDSNALLSIEFTSSELTSSFDEEQGCLMVWDLPGTLYSNLDLSYTKHQDGLYYGTLIISLRDGDTSSFSRKLLVIDNQGNEVEEVISFKNKDSLAFEVGYDRKLKKNVMIVTFENGFKWILHKNDFPITRTLDSNSGMNYRIEMGLITITGYEGSDKDLIIPNEINGKPVVTFGHGFTRGAFDGEKLTSVIIPESVTRIGGYAFAKNKLTHVIIPNNVTIIGGYAFAENQLTDVIIPNNVINIGREAFAENQLTNVIIPSSVINIGARAFWNNRLNSVTIAEGVKRIGWEAFSGNNLKSIALPNSVTSIKDGPLAFGKNLSNISVLEDNPHFKSIDGVLFSKDEKTIVAYPPAKEGSSYIIPNGVTTIGDYAFRYSKIKNITIPNSVTSLGGAAFSDMEDADSIIIPDSVISIESNTFFNSTFRRITIGENVALNADGRPNGRSFSQDQEFDEFYNNNGKRKGTYSRALFVGDNGWDVKWEYNGN